MRIVISNPNLRWGGWSTMTVGLALALTAHGHEVRVFCRPGAEVQQALTGKVPLDPVLDGMNLSARAIARCLRAFRIHRTDVLLSATSRDLRLSVPAARLIGVPTLVHRASLVPFKTRADHRYFLDRLPDHHVANSWANREVMLASAPWLPASRVSMIHNAIDTARIERAVPAELGLPPNAVAVGFVGRLVPEKGLAELAAAWRRIAADLPQAHLFIAGVGPGEARLRASLERVPRVHWLGFRHDVPELMKAFDLLAVPSWCEPFGLVAVEAMAAGTPVVATRAGGLAEVLSDGVHGYFVPPRGPTALAQRILDLARDRDLRQRMGEAGVVRAREHFSMQQMIAAYEQLLRAVAARGREAEPVLGVRTN